LTTPIAKQRHNCMEFKPRPPPHLLCCSSRISSNAFPNIDGLKIDRWDWFTSSMVGFLLPWQHNVMQTMSQHMTKRT